MAVDIRTALIERVCDIAREAGNVIRSVSRETADVREKSDGSPVTRADMAAHEVIMGGLTALDTGYPVLSEEGDPQAAAALLGSDAVFWLVDPLDGTKEFLKENGEYTVNIALVDRTRPVLGVVYAPVPGLLYYAAEGLCSWRIDGSGQPVRLHGGGTDNPVVAVVSRSHPSPETDAYLARFAVTRRIARGSSLKLCVCAEGGADIYPRLAPTSLWDTAAGAVVAREAGCRVVDTNGDDLVYNPARGVLQESFVVYAPETVTLPV